MSIESPSVTDQSAGPYELQAGPYASGELRVCSLRGREAISECFRFDVEFASDVDPSELRGNVVGQSASLILRNAGGSRTVQGIVASLRQKEPLRTYDRRFRIRVVPRLWLLRRRTNTRIFQDASVIDVVSAVLKGAGVSFRVAVQRRYTERAYCVQYTETDYDFVQRLLREAGIFYYFEPGGGTPNSALGTVASAIGDIASALSGGGAPASDATMVLCDASANYQSISGGSSDLMGEIGAAVGFGGGASAGPTLFFRPNAGVRYEDDHRVSTFESERVVQSKKVTVRDYDFQKPLLQLQQSANAPSANDSPSDPSSASIDPATLEVYEHHGEYDEPDVAKRTAQTLLEGFRAATLRAEGSGPNLQLAPGYKFTLDEHPDAALNQEYVVIGVEHEGWFRANVYDGTNEAASDDRAPYANRFTCLPSSVPARPRPTPRRLQQVMEVATVVGPEGEEIYTDSFGRIKVQFPWDRQGQRNEHSSCWMRVGQAWAGQTWGAQFIPRVGMEVLVTFLGGDVDRPMVIGSVYNGINPTPFELPRDKTRSGWRTQSTAGAPADLAGALADAAIAAVGAVAGAVMGGGDPLSAASSAAGALAGGAANAAAGAAAGAAGGAIGGALGAGASAAGGDVAGALGAAAGAVGSAVGGALGDVLSDIAGALTGSHGSRGYNELSFEDSSGAEQVFLRAQRDLDELVLRNHTSTVKHDETNVVNHDQRDTVRGDRHRNTMGNEQVRVSKDQTIRVDGNRAETVAGNQDFHVHKDVNVHVGGREHREITKTANAAYNDDVTIRVRGSLTTLVGKQDAKRSYVVYADGSAKMTGSNEVEIASDRSILFRCGKSTMRMTPDGIEINAPSVNVIGKSSTMSAGDKLKLTTKGQALLLADKMVFKASKASLSLDQDAKLGGSTVQLGPPVSAQDDDATATPPTTLALVDTSGKPVPNQRYVITLEDGSVVSGVTDKDGKADLAVEQSGTVTFPDLSGAKKQ